MQWETLLKKRPLLMGILNVTPDSFSNGGLYFDPQKAISHALMMAQDGADIIDVGGESTRPFAQPVSEEEEMKRVIPAIKVLSSELNIPISIDTYKAKVAKAAIEAGAKIVNDISALRFDSNMVKVIADYQAAVILMHMKGTPKDMQINPFYKNVIKEVYEFLFERIEFALSQGINLKQIAIDPGIGFGKRLNDNLILIKHIAYFKNLGRPVLLGPSRKSFIGQVLGIEQPNKRDIGTLGVVAYSVLNGVDILRVHAIKETRQVIDIINAIKGAPDA